MYAEKFVHMNTKISEITCLMQCVVMENCYKKTLKPNALSSVLDSFTVREVSHPHFFYLKIFSAFSEDS